MTRIENRAEPTSVDHSVNAAGAVLDLRGVGKIWPGGTVAVRRVDFGLRRGDFVSLVGPSGCGKSTVLRIVAGLEEQTSGRVVRPDDPPGCVFQQPNLLAWRNLLRNVELYAELDGMRAGERRALTRDALQLVGLTGFEDHLPHQLSGGMQMRAALARALVTRPELLLFDEPFSAVDELLRERLQEELMRLFTAERFAGLFITHSVTEAVFLSTRVLVMTPRPGTIGATIDVPLPFPRPPELRFAPEFIEIVREVAGVMRGFSEESGA
ncbi:MAG: NitT/TauT family transport system ATP-binding protein [Gaiellales bacterium]|nr:NitT/TauT family transport system ATP-binding protein [Gaiellales bacterium]